MKRTTFLKTTAAALSAGALGASCTPSGRGNGSTAGSPGGVARLNLNELRQFYHGELFDRYLPNMERTVVDHDHGGFMCDVNIETGERNSTNKSAWYEGRGMWAYAFLYNYVRQSPEFLEVARNSKDFILRHRPEPGQFWPPSFTREGERREGSGNIYGNLFISEGLAEYAFASGEEEYFDLARDIMIDAMEQYDSPDYRYAITYLTPDSTNIPGVRVLGHWMVLLIGSTHMLMHREDPAIREISDRSIDAIMNHHLNAGYRLLNEGLNHDLSLPDNEFAQFAYMGHGIETLWMVMYEAVRRRDADLFTRSAAEFKHHVQVAHDAVYGGYFRSLDHVDDYRWKVDKVLWLQEEVLIGTMMMVEHMNDPWAADTFNETLDYVRNHFVHPGYRFWSSGGSRKLDEYRMSRAEHYHHPRHLMLNLLALDRMIERDGQPSGLLS